MDDFILYLKSELMDAVYLQQDAFSETDAASPVKRQLAVFETLESIVEKGFAFGEKDQARRYFLTLTQAFKDWHQTAWESEPFKAGQAKIIALLGESAAHA